MRILPTTRSGRYEIDQDLPKNDFAERVPWTAGGDRLF
jgi:hypothetical protein